MFGPNVFFASSSIKIAESKTHILCPYDFLPKAYAHTWAPGRYVFSDLNNPNIRVIYMSDWASDEMVRVNIPVGGTLVINEDTPHEVTIQAKELGLRVAVLKLEYI